MQPIEKDRHGVLRFKRNEIVKRLLEFGERHGHDMNHIALGDFTDEDRRQFAQLVGYSVSGYASLPYVRPEDADQAALVAKGGMDPKDARIKALEEQLAEYRRLARRAIEDLNELLGDS